MFFTDHHAYLLAKMLTRIDSLGADIANLGAKMDEQNAAYAAAVARLTEIRASASPPPRDHRRDRRRYDPHPHRRAPGLLGPLRARVKESAGRKKGTGPTGHGKRYLARALGEAAIAASRTDAFLGQRYRRLARRRGKQRAIVAVGRSILIVILHLLSNPDARFRELGSDFYDTRINAGRHIRNHIAQLEALGYKVTLELAA